MKIDAVDGRIPTKSPSEKVRHPCRVIPSCVSLPMDVKP